MSPGFFVDPADTNNSGFNFAISGSLTPPVNECAYGSGDFEETNLFPH